MKRFPSFSLLLVLFIFVFSVTAQDTLYTKQRGVRVRAEASTSSTLVTTLARGVAVTVIGEATGTRVSGSTVWYEVTIGQYEGYIHSSLLTSAAPVIAGNSGSSGSGSTSPTLQSTPAPLVEQPVAPPPQGASCGGATTCGQMANCDQARACLAAGNGRLDADKDGIPCESICGG